MMKIEEAFEQKYCHQVFHGVRDHIARYKLYDPDGGDDLLEDLTEGERVVMLINGFIWGVVNGGWSQFLSNDTGNDVERTLEALEKIEAKEAVDALHAIRQEIFQGQPIPTNREQRCQLLSAWEEADEDRAEALYDKYDLGFCESVEEAVAGYILANKAMFFSEADKNKKIVTLILETNLGHIKRPSLLISLLGLLLSFAGIYGVGRRRPKMSVWMMEGELREEDEYITRGQHLVGPVLEEEAKKHLKRYITTYREQGMLVGTEFATDAARVREKLSRE